MGQLLETLAIETAVRNKTKCEQINNTKKEEIEFLTKCRNLIQTVILGPLEANTDKPLKKSYQLFESMVLTLQSHLQNTKEDQIEETSRLLRQQYTTFSEAHKVLQDHLEESIITNEVLRDWPTYYGQVFQ